MAEEELPIDIHYNKLLDWLVDRKHCSLKWRQQLTPVREKMVTALNELPQDARAAVSKSADDMLYYDCCELFDQLKSMLGEDKNILGQYNSTELRTWRDLIQVYEKDNVHLAEAAQLLTRMVRYEIPSLKRQISRCQQQQKECSKRAADSRQCADSFKAKFSQACADLEIKGDNIHHELSHLVQELPNIFNTLVTQLPSLLPAISYYEAFRDYCNTGTDNSRQLLPVLSYLVVHGNTTVYEWTNGQPPPSVTQCAGEGEGDLSEDASAEIDWGELTDTSTAVQYGNETEPVEDRIDFELDSVDLSAIVIEGGGEELVVEEGGEELVVVEERQEQQNAITHYPTLLEEMTTRNKILDDLLELREFLDQRLIELSTDTSSLLLASQLESTLPESVSTQSSDGVRVMVGLVRSVVGLLCNQRTQHLLMIQNSQSYLTRLTDSLQHHLKLSRKATSQIEIQLSREEEARTLQTKLEPQLVSLIRESKRLQKLLSADISKRYKNRPVHIMGEINQI